MDGVGADRARVFWLVLGIIVISAVVAGAIALGAFLGGAIIALPVALGGLLLMGMSHSMAKRTARGRELLRRTLGFRLYIATADGKITGEANPNGAASTLPGAVTVAWPQVLLPQQSTAPHVVRAQV